ncbi:MAG: hypothetical protein BECKG1743D_GA0114223_105482 [Candidatus Kentron sp. G]|nr:MAG: hypothetical protein BECKG1743F_GA0114225_105233 [Candidatus Kentron sp. G]VFN02016.1 MAG: hypothetical protein BECKG1743E_GA0114224_104633 [Candidatus Kentron sp. G]VFN04116.1 MAG: hypothetical protein BECKG1743D_GA0114223_105482 [Candidatus Kentron sp. G]
MSGISNRPAYRCATPTMDDVIQLDIINASFGASYKIPLTVHLPPFRNGLPRGMDKGE